jgi:Tfp pilus assembly protein PilO
VAIHIQKHVLLLSLGYLATAAAAAGGGYFCYEEYKAVRDEEASVKQQIELADVKIARIEPLEVDVICLRENLSYSVRILPNSTEVNEFVTKLATFADESGVDLKTLDNPIDRSKNKEGFDKVIYKAELTANTHQFLKFLSLAEGWERFVRVTKIQIKAGDWTEELAREDVRHDVSVELETYSYQSGDPSKTVAIQNYDRRVEQLQDEILLRRSENQVETYTLVENPLRRDVMVDPRRRVTEDTQEGWPYEEQRIAVETLVALAEQLNGHLASLKQQNVNFIRRLEIETEVDRLLGQITSQLELAMADDAVTDTSLKRQIEKDVRPVVQQLLDRDPDVSSRATVADLRRFRDELKEFVAKGAFEQVLKRHQTMKGRVDGKNVNAEAATLLNEIDRLAFESQVALDFAGKDIEIKGAIVSPTGSIVVVNGRVLHEGDALEEDLVIHSIASDRIEFRFRGVVLTRSR